MRSDFDSSSSSSCSAASRPGKLLRLDSDEDHAADEHAELASTPTAASAAAAASFAFADENVNPNYYTSYYVTNNNVEPSSNNNYNSATTTTAAAFTFTKADLDLLCTLDGVAAALPAAPATPQFPSRVPSPLPIAAAASAATTITTSSSSSSSSSTLLFSRFFKPIARPMRFLSLGSFALPPRYTLQYVRALQPIANGICCEFTWFKEAWRSRIDYVLLEDGGGCGATVLRFSITHEASGEETFQVETAEQALARNKMHGCRTVCNGIFLQALERCKRYVDALPPSPERANRLRNLLSGSAKRRCTESTGLFGLRSQLMYHACLDFLQQQQEH